MSLDRHLRDGLDRSSHGIEEHDLDIVFGDIVRGARRRLLVRRLAAAAFLLAVSLSVFFLGPRALDLIRDAGSGSRVPADNGTGSGALRVPGYGFGISSDGMRIFASVEATGAIYDTATGALLQTLSGNGEGVVAFSPDGDRFVTVRGGNFNDLRTFMYDTATGEELWRISRACCFAAFSPDGSLLAIPQNVPHTSVIDVETGERVIQVDSWGATAFSPDGQQLLITPDPGAAPKGVVGYVYEVFGEQTDPVMALHGRGEGNIPSVYAEWDAWSADGSMIAIPTSAGEVFVWDVATGERKFVLKPPSGDFTFTGFSVDGDLLAVASTKGSATIFDLSGEVAETVTTFDAYNKGLDHVVFGPGSRLMTAAWNRPTKVWNVSL